MEDQNQKIGNGFRKALNSHGYGFQYAVFKAIQDRRREQPNWTVQAAELGVRVLRQDTRIDLVIQKGAEHFYLIAECKRANPKLSNWCFAKVTWPGADRLDSTSYVVELHRNLAGHCNISLRSMLHTSEAYQIALPMRDNSQQGDQRGGSRDAIENALTQVCSGFNGFLQFVASGHDILEPASLIRAVPVIFTTAKLLVSSVDIGTADLQSGELQGSMNLEERDWIWFDYAQSLGIMHSIVPKEPHFSLTEVFLSHFLQRVAIVSAQGINDFLSSEMWHL